MRFLLHTNHNISWLLHNTHLLTIVSPDSHFSGFSIKYFENVCHDFLLIKHGVICQSEITMRNYNEQFWPPVYSEHKEMDIREIQSLVMVH